MSIIPRPDFARVVPSDYVLHRNDPEKSTTSTSAIKLKEIAILVTGVYRVQFFLKTDLALSNAYAQIYRNGSAYGVTRSCDSIDGATFSEDLLFVKGDKCQLYAWGSGDNSAIVKNFRLLGTFKRVVGYNTLE